MDKHKRFGSVRAGLYNIPEEIIPEQYYELGYGCIDTDTDDFDKGYIGAFGSHVVSFDGCNKLPNEIVEMLHEAGFSTDKV